MEAPLNHVDRLREIDPELAQLEEQTRDGAHESLEYRRGRPEDVERVWREFWFPALAKKGLRDGFTFSIEALKAELYDAYHLIMEAPKVYRHVTGGMCDDPCASAEGINAMADEKRAKAIEIALDPVYNERNRCVAAIAAMAIAHGWNAGLGLHEGETCDDEWRTVVFVDLPTGQVSWHIHTRELPLFRKLPPYKGVWDGHTTEQKYARLAALTGHLLTFTQAVK